MTRRRILLVATALAVAGVVGAFLGFRAAVAVALAAITIPLLVLGTRYGREHEESAMAHLGRERFRGHDDGRDR